MGWTRNAVLPSRLRRKKAWAQILDLGGDFEKNHENGGHMDFHWVDHLPVFVV